MIKFKHVDPQTTQEAKVIYYQEQNIKQQLVLTFFFNILWYHYEILSCVFFFNIIANIYNRITINVIKSHKDYVGAHT